MKTVRGYKGIPFSIQRLCELLTESNKHITSTQHVHFNHVEMDMLSLEEALKGFDKADKKEAYPLL